jgi:hypothetical protein
MTNSLTERFKNGIKKYGYDSDFRRQIEKIVYSDHISVDDLKKCFDEFGVN